MLRFGLRRGWPAYVGRDIREDGSPPDAGNTYGLRSWQEQTVFRA